MMRLYRFSLPLLIVLLSIQSASIFREPDFSRGKSIPLAAFTDPGNGIHVSLQLVYSSNGNILLAGTFLAPRGYHLYSKDIVRLGFVNQGRPTLLDLPSSSKMRATGVLAASAPTEIYGHDPEGPPVYPEGPVTLSLPVSLPSGQGGWTEDVVSLTYMACSITTCSSPTVGKQISVRVPELAALGSP